MSFTFIDLFSRLTKINEQGKRIKQIMVRFRQETLQRLKPKTFHRLIYFAADSRASHIHWLENKKEYMAIPEG